MKELISKDILAILPTYIEGEGNCTIVLVKDGSKIKIKYTIRTVIRRLCAYYRLDLRESNRQFKDLFKISNGIPVPISKDRIYIQIKVREPIGKDDGAMGFIKLDAIKKIVGTKGEARILLNNGAEVACLCSQKTLRKHMNIGQLAKRLYEEDKDLQVGEAEEYYISKDTPATKSDIARLFMMIEELRQTFISSLK